MSQPTTATLSRIAAVAGGGSAVILLVNAFALTALVGVEFVINLVFADVPDATVDALRAGTLGVALTVASIAFLLGTLGFVAAMLRSHELPPAPLALYAVGAVPIALRAFVPEVALDLGLVTLAVGIGWISVCFFHRSSREATGAPLPVTGVPLVPADRGRVVTHPGA